MRAAPSSPAPEPRENVVNGLTDQTCKLLSEYYICFNFLFYQPREGCCFQDGLGYGMGEVIGVTVSNCTEVKSIIKKLSIFPFSDWGQFRPLWFVREGRAIWPP